MPSQSNYNPHPTTIKDGVGTAPFGGVIAGVDSGGVPREASVKVVSTTSALAVAIVDGSGAQITSFGGGSQYTDGDAAVTHPIGTIPVFNNAGTITAVSAANPLPVSATISSTGSSIEDGANAALKATVLDLTDSNPLTVAMVDANGDQVSSFGGGTQYTEDAAAAANPIGTALNMVRDDARGGSLTSTDGDNVAVRGTNAGELYVKHVDPIPVTQSGTWDEVGINDSGNSITVDNGGTFAVQATVAAGAANIAKAEDAASASADVGVPAMAIQLATPGDLAGTDADYAMLQMSAGRMWTSANIDKINGVTPLMGTGVMGTGSPRVTIASDNDALTVKQATGTNLHVVADTGSTTAVTQATGTNLHTVVDSGTVTTVSTVTNLSQMGGVAISLNTGVRDAGTQRVTIATNDVVPASQSGTWTVQPGNTANTTAWKVDGSAVTQPVSIATNTPVGNIAHDGADSGAPIKVGGRATNAEIAAVSANDRVDAMYDLVGKQIVLPYANPENFVSGATAAMTGTTSTSLLAAPASGLRNYITQITVANSHATVGTVVNIQDGSGGTTLYTIPAASLFGGATLTFPTPLRQPTTATAIFCACVTTGSNTFVSCSGYKGA